MRELSLFSGIGGFSVAARQVWGEDHRILAFCEKNKQCQSVLRRHWPDVRVIDDVRDLGVFDFADTVELISGGDPCPIRSRARGNGASKHPDLSGYFLALVGKLRPRWVVRENVPAPDDCHFTAALEMLGYGTVIVRTDAASLTGQRRIRDFIVGSTKDSWKGIASQLFEPCDSQRYHSPRLGSGQVVPCLTTHRTRYDSRDCYVYDGALRVLDGDERQALAGLPAGWIDGVSEGGIARMCGNAIVPAAMVPIFQAIKTSDAPNR